MKCSRLRNRGRYLEEAMLFRDTDLIKVITGVRRCGKSSLLELIRITIESEGGRWPRFCERQPGKQGCGHQDGRPALRSHSRVPVGQGAHLRLHRRAPENRWLAGCGQCDEGRLRLRHLSHGLERVSSLERAGHLSVRALRRGKDAAPVLLRVR